ncbi:MAG TPA: glycosyltransferase family 39 protein [Elusimicrobiales bacterium]|nr:glycosyltransferase family 39 protein [Elusimicrobiales bacterium]
MKPTRRELYFFILLLLLPAAAFKTYTWAHTGPLLVERSFSYLDAARELPERGTYSGMETLRRTPGYPLFLAAALAAGRGSLRAVTLAQHLLGLGAAFFLMRLALLLWESRAAAAAVFLLVAFHPVFIFYESSIESELVSVFLFCVMLFYSARAAFGEERERASALAAGLAGGAAALTRPELALCAIVPAVFILFPRKRVAAALYFFLPFAALVTFWMLRNLVQFGSFTLTPMGAITSLQTSGPLIDWDAPGHADFKKVYAETLRENGGEHRTVVNRTIEKLIKNSGKGTETIYLEAAELGRETMLRRPFSYLLATAANFRDFLPSLELDCRESAARFPATPGILLSQQLRLPWLALFGFAAALRARRTAAALFALSCAVCLAAANCLVEVGLGRRSFEVLPLLALSASYLYAAAAALPVWRKIALRLKGRGAPGA